MALPRLTFARVKSARKVGDTTLLDIAVQTEGGEVSPGEIVAGGFVTGDSLIFGAMVGDKFVPWRNGGRRASVIRAKIDGSSPIGYGRYQYQWTEVEPSDAPGQYAPPSSPRGSSTNGPLYNGLESPNLSGGTLGSGVDAGTLPSGFNPVPLGDGAVVWIEGPFGLPGAEWWECSVSTHVDGSCGGGA